MHLYIYSIIFLKFDKNIKKKTNLPEGGLLLRNFNYIFKAVSPVSSDSRCLCREESVIL